MGQEASAAVDTVRDNYCSGAVCSGWGGKGEINEVLRQFDVMPPLISVFMAGSLREVRGG